MRKSTDMHRRKFNEYRSAEPMQPCALRKQCITTWLTEQLARGPAWPHEITRRAKERGYTLQEVCAALTAARGERDRVGQWVLPALYPMETP